MNPVTTLVAAVPSTSGTATTAELLLPFAPLQRITPRIFLDLDKQNRLRRDAETLQEAVRVSRKVVERFEDTERRDLFGLRSLARMAPEIHSLHSATASSRAAASHQSYGVLKLLGRHKPQEEKPRRQKFGRKGIEIQAPVMPPVTTPKTQEKVNQPAKITTPLPPQQTPTDRVKIAIQRPLTSVIPTTTTPQPHPAPPPSREFNPPSIESNHIVEDDEEIAYSPPTPPVAINKGKRRAAATVAVVTFATTNSLATSAEKSDKRPKREGNIKKRTSNRLSKTPRINTKEEDEPTYCFCSRVSFGEMIGCDNDKCEIEWFHFECIGLTTKPKGKWFCPNCRHPDSARMPKSVNSTPIMLRKEPNNLPNPVE